jgi:anti-sigma B factor antagonist
MADDVDFVVTRHASHTVIAVTGYLDVSTSPRFREKIHSVADEAPPALIIDLGEVEFLDSSALGVVLNGWKLMQAAGGVLTVVSPQPRITKVFEITALHLSINVFPSMAEAVDALN